MKKAVLIVLCVLIWATPALADKVLIVHQNYNQNNLQALLVAKGHTDVTQATSMPADISAYDQVWDIRYNTALSAGDIALLVSFLASGKAVFLLGEGTTYKTRNDSVAAAILAAGGGTVTISSTTAGNNSQTINSPWNTEASSVTYLYCGKFEALGTGTFITNEPSSTTTGSAAAWTPGSLTNAPTGRLTSILDVNVLDSPNGGNRNELVNALIDYSAGEIGGGGSSGVPAATPLQLALLFGLIGLLGMWKIRRKS